MTWLRAAGAHVHVVATVAAMVWFWGGEVLQQIRCVRITLLGLGGEK